MTERIFIEACLFLEIVIANDGCADTPASFWEILLKKGEEAEEIEHEVAIDEMIMRGVGGDLLTLSMEKTGRWEHFGGR